MRRMMTVAVAMVLGIGTAHALEVHGDFRFSYAECPTWTRAGDFSEVRPFLRIKETWDTAKSNYPTGWEVRAECKWRGQTAPMPKPGEYVVPGNLCKTKIVIPNVCAGGSNDTAKCRMASDCPMGACVPGTEPATSSPAAYMWINADYNGNGQSFPSGCRWDPWAYGAPTAPMMTMP